MATRFVVRAGRVAPRCMEAVWSSSTSAPTSIQQAATKVAFHHHHHHHAVVVPRAVPATAKRFLSDKAAPPVPEEELEEKTEERDTPTAAVDEPPSAGEQAAAEPEVSREEQLEAEAKQLKDQLLRSLAEQENTRRIAQRDVADARNFAVKSFAKSLLDVSDNLSRALDAVPEEMRHDTKHNATLATLYEGIEMTKVGLIKAFEANGLQKFGQPGDAFDPNKHQALYEYPDPDKEAGTVGQVMKVGFMLNDRVLRPAEVGVVKKA